MDAIDSHDTSVILLHCSALADDSDRTGYYFPMSVIKHLIGKEAQCILHIPGFCPPSPLSAEVEPETSCSHSDACQSCRLRTSVMKAATQHMCTLIYSLPLPDIAGTWSHSVYQDWLLAGATLHETPTLFSTEFYWLQWCRTRFLWKSQKCSAD